MDIRQLVFPFIMAVLTNSFMIVAIYFLRKSKYFANLFSVWFMIVLYLFGVLRLFLPIEFPNAQIVIMDDTVYTSIVEFFAISINENTTLPRYTLYVLLGLWVVGTIIFLSVSFFSQKKFRNYIRANQDCASQRERELLSETAKEILGTDKNITLKKTDAVNGVMVLGLVHKEVLIPDKEYGDEELRMIFRHECTHIRNKDLWIKLLIQIYCAIFWWNPFSYLLKHDLDFSLEMKCDLSLVKNFSDTETAIYIETLRGNVKSTQERRKPFIVCAELSDGAKNRSLIDRVKAITANPPNKVGQAVVNACIALVFVAIFVVSYLFIWQPFYGPEVSEDSYNLAEGGVIVDDTNSYLVEQNDGSYLFYFEDFTPVPVTKEEFEQGLYEGYPILEK